ncbi:MAG: hypothetical protein AVDCRST_MAG49-1371 [uncultured Thermomicrobiales bacterium]|uniref:Uncharacterized protein n=1 Tax=uncultured Thermomicrobiales bacterium TaxID=1645740 RepID=A0A6J4UEZ3_9BACT|nr:MAG: hypothetical protein AVDCRST_MAG49-1371 [uncultured Thermomicrobiales bacterium]
MGRSIALRPSPTPQRRSHQGHGDAPRHAAHLTPHEDMRASEATPAMRGRALPIGSPCRAHSSPSGAGSAR